MIIIITIHDHRRTTIIAIELLWLIINFIIIIISPLWLLIIVITIIIIIIIIIIITIIIYFTEDFDNDEARLLKDVFDKYNKKLRPVLSKHNKVEVILGFTLNQIIDVVRYYMYYFTLLCLSI